MEGSEWIKMRNEEVEFLQHEEIMISPPDILDMSFHVYLFSYVLLAQLQEGSYSTSFLI